MDNRDKKRLEVIKQRLLKLRQLLIAAKQQPDDPNEIVTIQKEIDSLEAEGKKLRG